MFAEDGEDTVTGGNGDDILVAHTVDNVFAAEHDSLSGGAGNDTLFGEAADTLMAAQASTFCRSSTISR